MPLISWNQKLSVEVAEIDAEHRKLITMINTLTEAIKQGKGKAAASEMVHELKGYAETHFNTEETYFDRFGYPKAEAHKKQHAIFIRKISEFKDQPPDNQTSLSIQMLQFLSEWLIAHILGSDKQYTAFFHSKGLK